MRASPQPADVLLTPRAVADLLYVDPKTVTRWAVLGKIPCMRTPGGHRRYLKSDVLALMSGLYPEDEASSTVLEGEHPPAIGSPSHGGAPHVSFGEPTGDDAAAAAVIAEAVAIALEAAATEAAEAVVTTSAAVSEAAQRAAEAAETARGAREFAASAAAEMVARDAERTATWMQIRADAAATRVADAAQLAAEELLQSIGDGTLPDAADLAILLANTVRAAAHATTQDTLRQSIAVERKVAAAATQVAQMVVVAEDAIAQEVSKVAQVVEKEAIATAATLAQRTDARAAGVAIAAREAAAAILVAPAPDPCRFSKVGTTGHIGRPSAEAT